MAIDRNNTIDITFIIEYSLMASITVLPLRMPLCRKLHPSPNPWINTHGHIFLPLLQYTAPNMIPAAIADSAWIVTERIFPPDNRLKKWHNPNIVEDTTTAFMTFFLLSSPKNSWNAF